MMKERLFAIVVGFIMLSSVLGFALVNMIPEGSTEPEIPSVVKDELSPADVVFILRNGKTLFRYYYDINDQKSLDDKITLEIFLNKVKDYVVLNEVEANETKLEIISVVNGEGKIIEFEDEINEQSLFSTFCEIALTKPKECFLYSI